MNVELRERSFGELIGLSFQLAVAHFGKLLVIVVLLGLPGLGFQLLLPAASGPSQNPVLAVLLMVLVALLWVLAFACAFLYQGAATLAVSGSFTGNHLTAGTCLVESLRRFGSLFAYSFVVQLLVGIGCCLIVPGCIFITWFFVGVPAVMIERISWVQALGRSRQLSEGHRWGVFFVWLVLLILVMAVTASVLAMQFRLGEGFLTTILGHLIQTVVYIPMNLAPVVYYFHLRVVKESFDVEQLSALVDAIAAREGAAGGGIGEETPPPPSPPPPPPPPPEEDQP